MNATSARTTLRPGAYGMTQMMLAINAVIALAAIAVAIALTLVLRSAGESSQVSETTLSAIAATGHADALAQRVLADVLQLGVDRRAGHSTFTTHADLNDTANGLDTLLTQTSAMPLPPDATASLGALHDAWAPIRRELAIIGDYPDSPRALDGVITKTLAVSRQLVTGLEEVRADLQNRAAQQSGAAANGRIAASVAIVIAAGIMSLCIMLRLRAAHGETRRFAGMLERMVSTLAKSTIRLTEGKYDDEFLKATGSQGVLSVGPDLTVVSPFSEDLKEMFEVPDLDGRRVDSLLRRVAPRKDHQAIDEFMEQLFNPAISDILLINHPLRAVEIRLARPDGFISVRTYGFEFRRMRDGNEIASVVIMVSDVSERVALEKQLRESERRRVRQHAFVEFGSTADPMTVERLSNDVMKYSAALGATVRAEDLGRPSSKGESVAARIEALQTATQYLCARAAEADLPYLANVLRRFDEDSIARLRNARSFGDEYLAFSIACNEVAVELESFRTFVTRFRVAAA